MTDGKRYNVLFLCTHNSARSIFGEAILNRVVRGRFQAYSAGSHPRGEIHPQAVTVLKAFNYEPERFHSKDWAEFAQPGAPELDFVFTVCDRAAKETCPVWPGQPMSAHWGAPDPSLATGNETERALAFTEAYRILNNRINAFTSLPIASLDALSLQRRLDAIGKSGADKDVAAQ